MTEATSQSGTMETPADAGKGDSGIVSRWMKELDLADRTERNWRKRGGKATERFRDEGERTSVRFNILYSNTQTLEPSLYNSTPKPDVRRRFRDPDPLGKQTADVLERVLATSLDGYDFDSVMQAAVQDYLLPGRGVSRVRYIPSFETVTPTIPDEMEKTSDADLPDEFKPYDKLVDEEVIAEPVDWEDFRRGPGKNWSQVRWVAFRHRLTRDEANDKFKGTCPDVGEIDLDFTPNDPGSENGGDGAAMFTAPDVFKRMTVWEIWSKDDREVIFIAPAYTDAPLKTEEDPLRLKDFFPIPRPLYAIQTTDSLVPVEEFRMYEDQAKELDKITARINRLINGLKLRGIYDTTIGEMTQLFKSDDNEMIPAVNVTQLMTNGGLEKAIWMLPIKDAAAVLGNLYQQRESIKQSIYEITGISDILRGASQASETATAQNIKSQWGSMRLQRRQREVQRYARDLIRLMGEIVGMHFSIDTLRRMSGVQMMTAQERDGKVAELQGQIAQIQQAAQMAAMAQQQAQAAAMMGHNGGPPMGQPMPHGGLPMAGMHPLGQTAIDAPPMPALGPQGAPVAA